MFLQIVVLSISLTLTLLFFVYGFNHYYLLGSARRYKSPQLPPDQHVPRPKVAIHLPVYNERYVTPRLVAACVRMAQEYGIDHVRILIIDDSDDETAGLLDEVVKDYQEKNIQIEVTHRGSRQGFKAGALQAALEKTDEDFIAIFDADFIPPTNFLVLTLPFFMHDECLGIIQSRWTHINRNYNILTSAIAIGIDVHFLIEQAGRYAAGCFQNFNGSGGVLRKKALLEAGGWQSDTLAEDLDASYRVQIQGYRILYLNDLQIPGEVPLTVPSFKKQQGRWACGSLRTAKKLLPILLTKRDLGKKKRLEGFVHLTGYIVHPLMFISFVLACVATLLNVDSFRIANIISHFQGGLSSEAIRDTVSDAPQYLAWGLVGLLILLCTVAAWIPPVLALRGQRLPVSRKFVSFLVLFLLGCGVSLSNTIEAGKALLSNRDWAFKRTPKYALQNNEEKWREKRYQVPLDLVSFLELAFVCLGGSAIGYAIWRSNFVVLLILVPFTTAYAFISFFTILQSRREAGI